MKNRKMVEIMISPAYRRFYAEGMKAAHDFVNPKADTALALLGASNASIDNDALVAAIIKSIDEGDDVKLFSGAMDRLSPQARRIVIDYIDKKLCESRKLQRASDDLMHERTKIKQLLDAYNEINSWADGRLVMEKPSDPSFPKLRRALARGEAIQINKPTKIDLSRDYEKEIFRHAQHFVVEHDWAAAFSRANIEPSFRLPYEVCAFDFRFNGRDVVALAIEVDEKTDPSFTAAVCGPHGWIIPGVSFSTNDVTGDDNYTRLLRIVSANIRAVSIALEADVATTTVIREPNEGRVGKNSYVPPRSYHVVSLARHARAEALPDRDTDGTIKRRIRLHFRRGHWRHFEKHKTWIKWMLIGDPALGFIDKHYKL